MADSSCESHGPVQSTIGSMGIDRILSFQDLQRITQYQRRSDVERCLRNQGIRWFYGRRGLWTTVELVNQAGGLDTGKREGYDAGIL
jgi:hypothetical protein